MLDIKVIRDNPDAVKAGIAKKRNDAGLVDQILEADEKLRGIKTEIEGLRAEQKAKSKDFGRIKKEGGDLAALQEEVNRLKSGIGVLDEQLHEAQAAVNELMDVVPNLPHDDVPEGDDESGNTVVLEWGEPVKHAKPEPHWEIGERYGFMQEAGAAMSGSGFLLSVGPLARLERALIGLFLDTHTQQNGYQEVSIPFAVREPALYGTGYLPKLAGEQYEAERDGIYLIPTAEVPLTAINADTILKEEDLPKKYCAFSPCWRREAGAAGADNRGMVRVHQFLKVEMMQVVHPDKSYEAHEALTGHAEDLLQKLELPYRKLLLCSGDMSFAAAKCYDLEVWSAGVERWLEVSSCSNFESFQARRSGIRFKDSETGKNEYCHTLNGSGLALPRIVVALLENGLQDDGSVKLPAVLHEYYGKEML